jgi:hypothetical protein
MDEHHGQAAIGTRIGLPMTMAQDAASVDRIDLDRFRLRTEAKGRAGQEIAHNSLEMPVEQPSSRYKG